jgi:hypothetical protein
VVSHWALSELITVMVMFSWKDKACHKKKKSVKGRANSKIDIFFFSTIFRGHNLKPHQFIFTESYRIGYIF